MKDIIFGHSLFGVMLFLGIAVLAICIAIILIINGRLNDRISDSDRKHYIERRKQLIVFTVVWSIILFIMGFRHYHLAEYRSMEEDF
jgi:MFS family permease